VLVGVLDLNDRNVETAHQVATRIRAALDVVPEERLIVTPDCGMKYLPRDVAFAKLQAMVAGAKLVRAELGKA
jgi:5-methyltetrahydropteroyltriglutamate--homocysteine methyltransferase